VIEKYGAADVLQVKDVEVQSPGEGEIVIHIKAAGLNPADAKIRAGGWTYPVKFPAVLGWDAAGVVVARGYAARRFNVGDEVYTYARRPTVEHGCYAQYLTINESYVASKPTKASWEQAGGLPLAGLTAYQGLKLAGLKEKETIVVVGASGGVGSFVCQLAKNVFHAQTVIGIASAKSADYLKKLGVHPIDYKGDVKAEVAKLAADGVDVVYDCFGGDWPTQAEPLCKAEGSRVVSIASWTPPKYTKKIHFQAFLVEPHAPQLTELAKHFDDGKLTVNVDKAWNFSEAAKAHEELLAFHTSGKSVFKTD